jgi:WD40 repeat protein
LLHIFCGTILLFAGRAFGSEKTDAFGDPLPKGAIARIGTTKYRGVAGHGAARLSPDGKLIAGVILNWARGPRPISASIEVWELPAWKNRRVIRTLLSPKDKPLNLPCLTFTADGKSLAVADAANQRVLLFDLASGKCTRTLKVPAETPLSALEIVISRNQQILTLIGVAAQGKRHWFVWDLANNKLKHRFILENWIGIAISADCRWAAMYELNFKIQLWDLTAGRKTHTITTDYPMYPLAFSPDGKQLVANGRATLRVYEVATGKELHNLRRAGWARHALFTPDGQSFYASMSHRPLQSFFYAASSAVLRAGLAPDAHFGLCDARNGLSSLQDIAQSRSALAHWCNAVSDPENDEIIVWSTAPWKRTAAFSVPYLEHVSQLVLTPEGKVLALTQISQRPVNLLSLWEVRTGKMLSPTGVLTSGITTVSFSPRAELYVASWYGNAAWWNPRTGSKIRDQVPDAETIEAANVFENGAKAASLLHDTVRIWNPRTGRDTDRFVIPLGKKEDTLEMAVSPDGNYFAITTYAERMAVLPNGDSTVYAAKTKLLLWSQKKRSIVRTYALQEPYDADVTTSVFSPDNRWLAFLAEPGRLQLSRLDQSVPDFTIDVGKARGNVRRMVVSPDGKEVACAVEVDDAWKICICETASGKMRRELVGNPASEITCLAYSRDGALLASGSSDTTVLVWTSEPEASAKGAAPR